MSTGAHWMSPKSLPAARDRLEQVLGSIPRRWLLVDVTLQKLMLVDKDHVSRTYGVSTARAGIDAREGSFGTPPGVHRVGRKIGLGREAGTRFESREPIGNVWRPGEGPESEAPDLILSRILTLRGCEPGVNRGSGVDSEGRFIYIHGTPDNEPMGVPASHGCIRMRNRDLVELFDMVDNGTAVLISA